MPSIRAQGFTLIELVIGIVVLAIAMTVSISFLSPLAKRSIDPIYQIRAAELGSSLMNEILTKSFDQNSDHTGGGQWRCSEPNTLGIATTCSATLGPDAGETRNTFNDVDDYITGVTPISDSQGIDLSDLYRGYSYRVDVSVVTANLTKRIDLVVIAPNGSEYAFAAERWNY